MFNKGDIIEATKRGPNEGRHYILVWGDYHEGLDFEGIMLTHSSKFADNILLEKAHILERQDFVWDNTHFVNRVFIKLNDWGPFSKVGELTKEGLEFITQTLTHKEPITFDQYIDPAL